MADAPRAAQATRSHWQAQGRFRGARIGVLGGGLSSEREISERSAAAVTRALKARGYDVEEIAVGRDVATEIARRGIEVAFNALHGRYGEDGCIQGVLEMLGIPYTGAGLAGSVLAMDKWLSRRLLADSGVPVPPGALLEATGETALPCPLPVVVKPRGEGSSNGVSIVRASHELDDALTSARRYDSGAVIEQYIPGREVTVAVLDGRALAAMEVVALTDDFHTYAVKYTPGHEEFRIPAPIGELYGPVLEVAQAAHAALMAGSYSRVDLRVRDDGAMFVLECNTLPGLHELGWFPAMAAYVGIGFEDLIELILDRASLSVHETRLAEAR